MAIDPVARRVARKELRLFFASPVAWLFLASFAGVTLFVFFWVESFFARNIADVRPLFEWMPLLLIFLCAALTMRMWSEERRQGTLEHVLTQPAALWRFVLGKFRACFALLCLALLATLPLPLTVAAIAELDWGPVAAGYLASALLGAVYLAAGLFVSSRTDNPIVSLIGSVGLCGGLYLLGSPALTDFFDNRVGEGLRLLGSGARFESITRGVIDARDLLYYLSLTVGFLALNVYTLERERWASGAPGARHRRWRAFTWLLMANLVVANLWLHRLDGLRVDVTEGRIYSLSGTSRDFLGQLQEPLLLRGYFSAKTHPALAPLAPQLRDLLAEYQLAGGGRVRVEWLDPASDPALEEEANERFGIKSTPFQVADRYQSSLVNSYFDLLVSYGDEFRALGFRDLIEVRAGANAPAEVRLRNPEYEITRAIREVLYQYRSGGELFDSIPRPVELIGYVSPDPALPEDLARFRAAMLPELERVAASSGGRFSYRFIDPQARGGAVARQIADQWGFTPMAMQTGVAPAADGPGYYFYLTLADGRQVVQLPTGQFDPERFSASLEAGLKRFAGGFTSTVALAAPTTQPEMARYNLGGPTFSALEQAITRDYRIRLVDLEDGELPPETDILAVVAPERLSDRALFAIDQFLMRGGTVILATSPFTVESQDGELQLRDREAGLGEWLSHHGIEIGERLVLDSRNTAFPAPVSREEGDYRFREVRMIDYPYFIDVRGDGLAADHPVTANLPRLTFTWASPIAVEGRRGRRVTPLLSSSPDAWLAEAGDIMPRLGPDGESPFQREGETGEQLLGMAVQGRFESWFAEREAPALDLPEDGPAAVATRVLRRSPESARIVLFASNDFLGDKALSSAVSSSGTRYFGALELFLNTVDWALQDEQLAGIRSRGHFNRTIPAMERQDQVTIEYLNYGLALAWLALLALVSRVRQWRLRRAYARGLGL